MLPCRQQDVVNEQGQLINHILERDRAMRKQARYPLMFLEDQQALTQ